MSFGDAIGEGFFNFANFRDRAARAEYWWWVLFAVIVAMVATVLDLVVFWGWENGPFNLVTSLALLLPGLSVTVRRLHDSNRSGWWILLPIVPAILTFVGFIAALTLHPLNWFEGPGLVYIGAPALLWIGTTILLIVLMFLPSTPGNNRFGPNRYAGGY
jgi:uncharacterized membrane protein YhaH (DUF805 family)